MKAAPLALAVPAACAGTGAARHGASTIVLSYSIIPPATFDAGIAPWGGGICLGSARITEPKADSAGVWTADGRRIAFARALYDPQRKLEPEIQNVEYDPRADDDGRGRLEQAHVRRPARRRQRALAGVVSRRRVDCVHTLDRHLGRRELHAVGVDGTGDRLVADGAAMPDWSPDGGRLVFTVADDITVANADGTAYRVLAKTEHASEYAPRWSPDGKTIVFDRAIDEQGGVALSPLPGGLILVAPDGSHERPVNIPPGIDAFDAAWRVGPTRSTRPCVLRGTKRADVLRGTAKGDVIVAGAGGDVVRGGSATTSSSAAVAATVSSAATATTRSRRTTGSATSSTAAAPRTARPSTSGSTAASRSRSPSEGGEDGRSRPPRGPVSG